MLLAARRAALAPRGSHGLLLSDATDPSKRDKIQVPAPLHDFVHERIAREKEAYERRYPGAHDWELSSKIWYAQIDD